MYHVPVVRIYTRTGDGGETSLFSGGRVLKDHARLEAYGTLDELSSALGVLRAEALAAALDSELASVQEALFAIGSVVADTEGRHPLPSSAWSAAPLERLVDRLDERLAPLTRFVLPGGSRAAALAHVARTVCRRAERRLVALHVSAAPVAEAVIYLNRLSDALFVVARALNHEAGVDEPTWTPPRAAGDH